MPDESSVIFWLERLKQGDSAAVDQLWSRCFANLVNLARNQLHGRVLRVADEEDVAISAFHSFFRGVERGRYPDLHDRDNLWRLLVTITARKAMRAVRDAGRQKRGGGQVIQSSDISSDDNEALSNLASAEPTPELAAQVAEQCERLLAALGDADLRQIAVQKMEGFTNEEIAAGRGCAVRTVERKLRLIRSIWEGQG